MFCYSNKRTWNVYLNDSEQKSFWGHTLWVTPAVCVLHLSWKHCPPFNYTSSQPLFPSETIRLSHACGKMFICNVISVRKHIAFVFKYRDFWYCLFTFLFLEYLNYLMLSLNYVDLYNCNGNFTYILHIITV